MKIDCRPTRMCFTTDGLARGGPGAGSRQLGRFLGSRAVKAEPKEQPGHLHLEDLGVSKQVVMAAEARDRLDSGRRLTLRPYSSCMRWLTGEAAGR